MSTLGDALDRAMGGPERYISGYCEEHDHMVCLGYYGGRSCECRCHRNHRFVPALATVNVCKTCNRPMGDEVHRL